MHLKKIVKAYWLHNWNKKCQYWWEYNVFDHFRQNKQTNIGQNFIKINHCAQADRCCFPSSELNLGVIAIKSRQTCKLIGTPKHSIINAWNCHACSPLCYIQIAFLQPWLLGVQISPVFMAGILKKCSHFLKLILMGFFK